MLAETVAADVQAVHTAMNYRRFGSAEITASANRLGFGVQRGSGIGCVQHLGLEIKPEGG